MSITIGSATTVNEFVRQYPEAVRVFATFGIDTCCGGGLPIGVAASRHGVEMDVLLEKLGSVLESGSVEYSPGVETCSCHREVDAKH